jgi:DNA repair exonuclease SbcCD ATPase subunit
MDNNTELINGFGDVMQHIRDQEKRIEELKDKSELFKIAYQEKSFQYETLKKQKESESYKKKVDQLIQQKHELEAKVDEAQVAFEENKIYKKEIDAIRQSVENECEASGLMEVMNMRIEEAENKAREQELLKVIAETEVEKLEKENKENIKEIEFLKDVLNNQLHYPCMCCNSWFHENELEHDCRDVDGEECMVCLHCRDTFYSECDECRVWTHKDQFWSNDVCRECHTETDEDP